MVELGPTRSPAKKNTNFFRSTKHRIYKFFTLRTRVSTAPSDQPNSSTPGYMDELVQQADLANNFHLSFEESLPANTDELVQQAVLLNNLHLPFEIMQGIFHFATHQDDFLVDYTDGPFRYHKDLPWGISQVCREWRYVALSTPFLWVTLPTIDLQRNNASQSYVDFLVEVLRRSGNALIKIHVVDEVFRDRSQPVVDLLVQHSKRWEQITPDMPLHCLWAFQGAKGNLPALRTVIANWDNTDPSWINHFPDDTFDLFLNAPQLCNVNIRKGRSGELLLPYTGLLRYKLYFGSVNELNLVLSFSPGLINLELCNIDFDPHLPYQTFHFPNLVSLRILAVKPPLLGWLLGGVTSPVLEELQIHVSQYGAYGITPSVTSMLSRSSPSPLQKLDLRAVFNDPGELTDLLLLTPLLTHLDVPMPSFSDITALACPGPSGRVLVPILTDCVFGIENEISSEQMTQATFLANSRGPGLRVMLQNNGIFR